MIHAALFAVVFRGLAVVAGCMVLRMLLPGSAMLRLLTRPFSAVVAVVTPAVIPLWCQPVLAIFWLLTLRVVFYLGVGAYGLLPPVTT